MLAGSAFATDPTLLEPRLGRAASEGCIRISATPIVFLDAHGVLDADCEAAAARWCGAAQG